MDSDFNPKHGETIIFLVINLVLQAKILKMDDEICIFVRYFHSKSNDDFAKICDVIGQSP